LSWNTHNTHCLWRYVQRVRFDCLRKARGFSMISTNKKKLQE
jgi:hypothetical protein